MTKNILSAELRFPLYLIVLFFFIDSIDVFLSKFGPKSLRRKLSSVVKVKKVFCVMTEAEGVTKRVLDVMTIWNKISTYEVIKLCIVKKMTYSNI